MYPARHFLDGGPSKDEPGIMKTKHTGRRRNLVLSVSILGIALLGTGAASPLPPSRQARVALVVGEVRIDGKSGDIGMTLGSKARVETGSNSRCDIVFGGGNAISFGQNGIASIDFATAAIGVRLDRGGVTAVLKKLEKIVGKAAFDISTPQATAAVRGTSFCVWSKDNQTYVCACNGRVHFQDAMGGNRLDLAASHHDGRIFTKEGSRISVVPAGVLHHDDASVQSVAKDIDYTIDWTKIDD
jgi:ferric-dicitrate binding protein FerR (iron transport regulator)